MGMPKISLEIPRFLMKFKMNQLFIDSNVFSYITDRETFCPAKSPAERSGFYAKMPFPRFLIRNLGNNLLIGFHGKREVKYEISRLLLSVSIPFLKIL